MSSEKEDTLFKRYQELCKNINLDSTAASEAWEKYEKTKNNITMEGESLHWLTCAIYEIGLRTTRPTVNRSVAEGNFISLTSLLRHSNLSLKQFFCKIKRWMDMINAPDELKRKTEVLEGTFSVAYNVFKKYTPIYNDIFKIVADPDTKQHRNRRQRAAPCSTTRVFDFCWILFATVKAEDSSYSLDLVASYHLLLALCDFAFKNAFLDDRRDLLNPQFAGVPSNWSDPDYFVPSVAPCTIDVLCHNHDGVPDEVKYVKEYKWKRCISDLFKKKVLQGSDDSFTGLFDPFVFDSNLKNITKAYETHLLNKGDLDERIFLAEYRRCLLLKEQVVSNLSLSYSQDSGAESPEKSSEISGMRDTPISTATQNIARLKNMAAGRLPEPSDILNQIFKSCEFNPFDKIKSILKNLGQKFYAHYKKQQESFQHQDDDNNFASKRLEFAVILFYKFLENILEKEKKLFKDISHLVQSNSFYECLFCSSLQIVIISYNPKTEYTWILDILGIEPCHFVRIIELIVRSQDQLPRDAVKYLNETEQKIIESSMWKSGSPIWAAIKAAGEVPKFEDIALPGNVVYKEEPVVINSGLSTPTNLLQSPTVSAVDRFQSPISAPNIKKQLFSTNIIKPGQSVLQYTKPGINITLAQAEKDTTETQKPKKDKSLEIIFRKFYNLAGSRLGNLCNQLNVDDIEFMRKIFTVFEYSIRVHTELMKDRHLDQLLLCAVYVICKVSANKKNFTDILVCYRKRPKPNSDIYRKVLLDGGNANKNGNSQKDAEDKSRGDVICFYNHVYIQKMRTFALQFSTNSTKNVDVLLSPLPRAKSQAVSPRFQVSKNIFITPYESPNAFCRGSTYEYHFSRSPSQDLEKINMAISKGSIIGKRLLDGDSELPSKRIALRKTQLLVEQRKNAE